MAGVMEEEEMEEEETLEKGGAMLEELPESRGKSKSKSKSNLHLGDRVEYYSEK